MTQDNLSAQNFRDPLLRALGQLSNFTAHYPVVHKETFGPICTDMSLSLDDYGNQGNTGLPWVQKWIGWAYKELKKSGHAATTDSAGMRLSRGCWALTAAGIDEARRVSGVTLPETKVKTPVKTPVTTLVPTPALAPVATPITTYHDDPYIRGLAVSQSTCFGTITTRSTVCTRCFLRRECETQLKTAMSAFAAKIAEELAKIALKEEQPAIAAKATVIPEDDTKSKTAALDLATHLGGKSTKSVPRGRSKNIKVAHEAPCAGCGQIMPKGAPGCWVRSSENNPGGIYHPQCMVERGA